jgi:hypothetical protein
MGNWLYCRKMSDSGLRGLEPLDSGASSAGEEIGFVAVFFGPKGAEIRIVKQRFKFFGARGN